MLLCYYYYYYYYDYCRHTSFHSALLYCTLPILWVLLFTNGKCVATLYPAHLSVPFPQGHRLALCLCHILVVLIIFHTLHQQKDSSMKSRMTGFPAGTSGKEPACQCRRHKRPRFNTWVRKIPWRRAWQPTPVFLPGESHGERSLLGYGPWGRKELDTIEAI